MPLETHMTRPSFFPRGYRFRLIAMLGCLILIGATIYNLRRQARAGNALPMGPAPAPAAKANADGKKDAEWTETIVPGPADDDALEMEEARKQFEALDDGENLQAQDMPAYWRLMRWARSLSFAEMEERAKHDVPFVKLFDAKELKDHRGELIRLPMSNKGTVHIRRVVEWSQKGKKNFAGVDTVYELWGTTDESKSNPYLLVCPELPPEIPVQAEAFSEGYFVGYYLKVVKYPAADGKQRGAPMLIGRMRGVKSGKTAAALREEGLLAMVAIGAAILVAALLIVTFWRITRKKRGLGPALAVPSLPNADVEAWLENSPGQEVAALPMAAGTGSVVTNGEAHHAVDPSTPDSTDYAD
jgi:hypothetical protein